MALFGALLFDAGVRRQDAGSGIAQVAAAAALVLALGRLAEQALAAAPEAPARALGPLLTATQFGWVWLAHVALVAAAPFARRLAAPLSGAALALLALWGHGAAFDGETRAAALAAQALHLVAAGAWLGGLPLLIVALRDAGGVAAARRF